MIGTHTYNSQKSLEKSPPIQKCITGTTSQQYKPPPLQQNSIICTALRFESLYLWYSLIWAASCVYMVKTRVRPGRPAYKKGCPKLSNQGKSYFNALFLKKKIKMNAFLRFPEPRTHLFQRPHARSDISLPQCPHLKMLQCSSCRCCETKVGSYRSTLDTMSGLVSAT